ncbi:MAG: isoleucine--tRNA ligase [Candidatus Verstraetearchaeota archaeon]|nr:isoleucine--tRNA ligase [Candidatus Verstraetearchaeota archaeon]
MSKIGKMSKEYEFKSVEESVFSYWSETGVEEKVRSNGKEKFYFLDGPPYVTNPIHVGTAWNKILKDAFIRFYRMKGFKVRDQPGFDMHGLPIEVMVERKIGIKSKKEIELMGIENFIRTCKSFALENLEIATRQFKNLGVWMDWSSPYKTLDDHYIESVWAMLKKADERRLLSRGKKVVHWCPRCETVLAGYEATDEYRELEEESIYVKFKVDGKEDEYILIWTTTPWTLPANVAVMVHPDYTYARVRSGGEVYIMAEARIGQVFSGTGKDYEVIETFPGSYLRGISYRPPLLEEVPEQAKLKPAHVVVLSDQFVTLEEGTGCVHSAPGHGEEDHAVGEQYGLPDFCPVDERGRFTDEAGKYAGKGVRDSNEEIISDLISKGLLFKTETTKHRYPHCWRCKTPLILRTATQWFIKVTDIKERLLEENDRVEWIPDWAGRARFGNWIKNAKDWVISRQRYWGIPLPIWICRSCGSHKVVGSLEELKSNATTEVKELELHRPWVDRVKLRCPCGGEMERVPDVADVWMDSGSASFASLNYPRERDAFERWWPADLILEGQDQTRGWFYTLMVCSVVLFDSAPYKRVLMHGFTTAQDGRAMHKSLGNVVFPEEVIEKYGRDTLRWYELSCTTWEDLKFTWKSIEETSRFLKILWSTYYFASLYMSLDNFSPNDHPLDSMERHLRLEDKWVISKLEGLIKRVTEAMGGCRVFEAVRDLEEFMREDISRWYIKLIRRRTWTEEEDPDKIAAYVTLYHVLLNYLKLIAPIVPFLSEKIYVDLFSGIEGMPKSVHMLEWPSPCESRVDPELEEDMKVVKEIIEASYSARQSARIKTRLPLMRMKVVTSSDNAKNAVERLKVVVMDQANVKEIEVMTPEEGGRMKDVVVLPNRALLGPIFRDKSSMVAEAISRLNGRELMEAFNREGTFSVEVHGLGKIELRREYVTFQERLPDNYRSEKCRYGEVFIDTTPSEELVAEGLARDVIRRIQEMRKRADLNVDDYIRASVSAPSEEAKRVLDKRASEIAGEVRAKELEISTFGCNRFGMSEDWDIDGERYIISIEKIASK